MVERHKSWVCRRLSMIRSLSAQVVEDIKLGLIPSGSAMSLARLPQGNQADFDTVIQTHQLKAKESNRLIDLWCKTNVPGVKEFLIQYPRKALELASKDGSDEIDCQVPAWAAKWFSTLRALERVAAALRLRSKKKIGPLEEKLCKMLLETLDHVEKECDEALIEARQTLLRSNVSESSSSATDSTDSHSQIDTTTDGVTGTATATATATATGTETRTDKDKDIEKEIDK